jgi:hypothetical protein
MRCNPDLALTMKPSSLLWRPYLVLDALRRSMGETGWLRSLRTGKVEDSRGQALPWLTYPAIHFLDTLDLQDARIFEFGSGNSTLYWEQRLRAGEIRSYVGMESSRSYYTKMAKRSQFYRDRVFCREEVGDYFFLVEGKLFDAAHPFDLTIVDGPYLTHKRREMESALAITDSHGLIVVDDTQWLEKEIVHFCERHRMFRLDFAGFAPAVSYSKVTSVLFRDPWMLSSTRFVQPVGAIPCVHETLSKETSNSTGYGN